MDKHVYECDKLVVGGSLASLVYAYNESLPIVWTEAKLPYFFDVTNDGTSKLEIWRRLAFLLSLSGLAPFGDKADRYREEDGVLKVFGKDPYFISIKAKEIKYFDKSFEEKENTVFEVIDWVNVHSGMSHSHDTLKSNDEFVRNVHFYKSDRIDGNHEYKDLVALSYLTRKQLLDEDYSETYVRLKLLNMMKKAGIKGAGNGSYKGTKRFLSVRLEIDRREIRVRDVYRDTRLINRSKQKDPEHEQLAIWSDILGGPYDGT